MIISPLFSFASFLTINNSAWAPFQEIVSNIYNTIRNMYFNQ